MVEPTSISFARQDGNDMNHFKMTLTAAETELMLVLSDAEREELAKAGIAAPDPFHLKRIIPEPPPKSVTVTTRYPLAQASLRLFCWARATW